ncbi:MAG: glycosyltransferase family 4 protein [Phycisphaerales bacterium]|nr:glycosyltransferase family 4 protein [Phycisphaerales bacterium]
MPTICFVTYEIHPTTAGGCGVLIHHAAERLLAAGHSVVILIDTSRKNFEKFRDHDRLAFSAPDRIRGYWVPEICKGMPEAGLARASVFQKKSVQFAHALRHVLSRERVDFVEFFEYCGPAYYAMLERLFDPTPASTPVLGSRVHGSIEVLDRHGDGFVADRSQFLLHSLERRALSLAETVLVPSRGYYEHYYRDRYALPEGAVTVSSPPKLPFPAVRSRPDAKGEFTIAFIGRMFHVKGVDQLVHASVMLMKQRPDLRFTVDLIGYDAQDGPIGSYKDYLTTLIPQRLRDRFVFRGQLTHEEIARRLDHALFAVFPNRVESFCYALHETYDAGVPVIINDLPAFRDFFTHEKNCLVYDGTTGSLLAAMHRLIDEPATRGAITHPFDVDEAPLGGFYEQPDARRPLAPDAPVGQALRPLVVVLGDDAPLADWPALNALNRQTASGFQTLALVPATPDGEETLWWLGRPWHVRDAMGRALEPSDLLTTDALGVLRHDDRPDPHWLITCRRALARRTDLGFSGTWLRRGSAVEPGTLDIAPELYPFEQGERLPRVLVRTPPGMLLSDVLDASLQSLGLIGLVWAAVARHGHGVLSPKSLIEVRDEPQPAPSKQLSGLLLRYGAPFGDRVSLAATLPPAHAAPPAAPPAPPPAVTVEAKIRYADDLGGRTLASLAWKKLARRLTGRTPPSR